MEKKFKFSDKSMVSKIVYVTVVAILCVSAIVIGIVAANSRKPIENNPENPPISDGSGNQNDAGGNGNGGEGSENNQTPAPEAKLTFVSPAVGTVAKSHSTTIPVFSNTLDEWRIHAGIDISTELGDNVCAAAAGTVSAIYNHPMLGRTIEITHSDTHKSVYSNLNAESVSVAVGDTVACGAVIGTVGDSAISELADEPHLHFEMFVSGVSVNPLDYFSEESLKQSLGIVSGDEA
jgi:murein DD-endopeptidase MepM/ murein hydrolase activator NlpD